jgi:O-antigen/teichoic acid export membrane protein
VATALTELLWIVPDGVAQVLLPTGARTDDTEVFAPIFRLSMGVTVIAAAGVALLAGPCIEFVFGPSYASASTVVPLLAVAAVAGGAWKMVAADVVARASTGSRLTSALAGLAVMVALDLILIPGFGIRGAGFAAAVGYCAAFMVIGRSWKQTTGNRLRELIRLHPDDLRVVRNDGAIDPKRSLAT